MPDPTTAETPKIQRVDVAANVRHRVEGSVISAAAGGITDADKRAQFELAHKKNEAAQEARRNNPTDIKAELGAISKTERFSQEDLNDIKTKLELSDEDPTYKRLSYFSDYTEAARKAEANNTSINTELGAKYDNVRDAVVEGLIRDGGLLDKLPELSEITDPNAQKAYIEATLARDPRLHSEIAKRIQQILTDIKTKLSPAPELDDVGKLKKSEDNYDDVQKTQMDVLKSYLGKWGIAADDLTQLEKTLDLNDPAIALSDTIRYLKQAKGISDEDRFGDYINNQSAIDQAQKELAQLRTQQSQEQGKQKGRSDDKIATLEESIEALGQKITDKEGYNASIKGAYKARKVGRSRKPRSDEDFEASKQAFLAIRELSASESDLAQNINFITKYRHERDQVKQAREDKEADPEKKAKIEQRTRDKEQIKADLQETIARAVGGFLQKKFDDAGSDQNILLATAIKEAEEKGDKNLANNIKAIKNIINSRWGKFDETTRKTKYDKNQIGADMKFLAAKAANGEDGSKDLIATAVGYDLDEKVAKDKIAETFGAGKTYDTLSGLEKTQADATFKKNKEDFDKLHAEQSDTFKKRLLTDFFRARGFMDRTVFGKTMGELALTADEWRALDSQFSPLMEEGIKSSKEAQGVLKSLREKGIAPDSKLKWLLYILLALGGAAALGTVGVAAGPAIAGAISSQI